jgi:hypothetical protein
LKDFLAAWIDTLTRGMSPGSPGSLLQKSRFTGAISKRVRIKWMFFIQLADNYALLTS